MSSHSWSGGCIMARRRCRWDGAGSRIGSIHPELLCLICKLRACDICNRFTGRAWRMLCCIAEMGLRCLLGGNGQCLEPSEH